jgi:ribonuclease BN (tRNA processing enzyme)
MKLRVLGCSGGVGAIDGARARTTAFVLDDDVLIDAGTGVEDLSVQELAKIDHVFLSHSHLDHIAGLPLMVDSVGGLRDKPLVIHALPETIDALRAHIFNWVIWPDFTEIPHFDRPYMVFEPITIGTTVEIKGRRIKCLPANHTVAAAGFQMSNARGSIVYSGDTSPNDEFWHIVNSIQDLKYLIIETAFANREQDLAVLSKHMFPVQLGRELFKFKADAQLYITHLKPSDRDLIIREVQDWAGRFSPKFLERELVLEI